MFASHMLFVNDVKIIDGNSIGCRYAIVTATFSLVLLHNNTGLYSTY